MLFLLRGFIQREVSQEGKYRDIANLTLIVLFIPT
jgi:hypothetical protein